MDNTVGTQHFLVCINRKKVLPMQLLAFSIENIETMKVLGP